MYNKSRVTFEDCEVIQKELAKEFTPEDIEWRVGATSKDKTKGMALPYVTNRAIQNRLDEVFTPFGWKNTYKEWHKGSQLCGISVKFIETDNTVQWLTKWDGAENTEFESIKGGLSDSMKRAAVQWGIGRYLYSLPNIWVEIEQRGKGHYIKDSEISRLKSILAGTGKSNNDNPEVTSPGNELTSNKQNTNQSNEKSGSKATSSNNSNKGNTNSERLATKGQKNCLLKNKEKLNLSEDVIEKTTFNQADQLIKSLLRNDDSNNDSEKSNAGQNTKNEIPADDSSKTTNNEMYISTPHIGLVNSIISQVANSEKLNTNVVENKVYSEFNVSSIDKLLKSQLAPVISYLKKMLAAA